MIAPSLNYVFILGHPVREHGRRRGTNLSRKPPRPDALNADAETNLIGGIKPRLIPWSRMCPRNTKVTVVHQLNQFARQRLVPGVLSVWQLVCTAQPVRFAIQIELIALPFKRAKSNLVCPLIKQLPGV